jgi:Zn-finger nucleic acid-binding protein
MKCPKCDIVLSITDRQGIEIDYCPQCRGVWLDRGELDKIIERTAEQETPKKNLYGDDDYDNRRDSRSQDSGRYFEGDNKRPKKKSGWGDFFDF